MPGRRDFQRERGKAFASAIWCFVEVTPPPLIRPFCQKRYDSIEAAQERLRAERDKLWQLSFDKQPHKRLSDIYKEQSRLHDAWMEESKLWRWEYMQSRYRKLCASCGRSDRHSWCSRSEETQDDYVMYPHNHRHAWRRGERAFEPVTFVAYDAISRSIEYTMCVRLRTYFYLKRSGCAVSLRNGLIMKRAAQFAQRRAQRAAMAPVLADIRRLPLWHSLASFMDLHELAELRSRWRSIDSLEGKVVCRFNNAVRCHACKLQAVEKHIPNKS
jgi:hypothetical protein